MTRRKTPDLRTKTNADSTGNGNGIQPSSQLTPEQKRQEVLEAASTRDQACAGAGSTPWGEIPGRRKNINTNIVFFGDGSDKSCKIHLVKINMHPRSILLKKTHSCIRSLSNRCIQKK